MNKKITIKGLFGALFCVMAFLQLSGLILLFFKHRIFRVPNLVLGLVYIVVAYFLLKPKDKSK